MPVPHPQVVEEEGRTEDRVPGDVRVAVLRHRLLRAATTAPTERVPGLGVRLALLRPTQSRARVRKRAPRIGEGHGRGKRDSEVEIKGDSAMEKEVKETRRQRDAKRVNKRGERKNSLQKLES